MATTEAPFWRDGRVRVEGALLSLRLAAAARNGREDERAAV
jgi:hypothetical protein